MISPLHSIVVPVYCSREILERLVERVSGVMVKAHLRFELVLIDDGSQDNSFGEIKRLSNLHAFIRGFRLSRNFGHQAAVTIGLRESKGAFVAIIDDDLQDPPEILPEFFEAVYNRADVAYGVRMKRKEGIVKRFFFKAFYKILSWFSEIHIPLDTGDFCAMSRPVVNAMLQLEEANPFLRGLRAWAGFRQIGVEYERDARFHGKSGYTFRKYLQLAVTGIFSFSYLPLRLATYTGFATAFLALGYAGFVIVNWYLGTFEVPGYASLLFMVTFMGSLQLIFMGIVGTYLARLYDVSKRWPIAFVAETTD
ncbi:MAG: glycosyltransferase involved in cell wall biosynthesis [Candidatus Latescibacterota bacterium]